jgi:hypothetical protein
LELVLVIEPLHRAVTVIVGIMVAMVSHGRAKELDPDISDGTRRQRVQIVVSKPSI